MLKLMKKTKITSAILLLASTFCANATVVEIQTSLGNIQVNLFDETTPQTVENFLSYVNSGAYADSVIHRVGVTQRFVVQGGGFIYTGPIEAVNGFSLDSIPTGSAVINDPVLSNLRGTIAMAKLGGQPDSATSQWYINLSDNNVPSLDPNINGSGGYTVFGQVIGDAMQVADEIDDQIRINLGGAFEDLPIRNYTQEDATNGTTITDNHLVIVNDIVVVDPAVVTNPDLNPVLNTLINPSTPDGGDPVTPPLVNDTGSGGGALSWLLALAGLSLLRARAKHS